jgi:hypothetical protein
MSLSPDVPARRITIAIQDADGVPLAGALVRITVDGQSLGILQTGADPAGVSSLSLQGEDLWATVSLHATYGSQTQDATLPPGEDNHVFVFDAVAMVRSKGPAVARCPDGTSNSPCVDCSSGTRQWRICA